MQSVKNNDLQHEKLEILNFAFVPRDAVIVIKKDIFMGLGRNSSDCHRVHMCTVWLVNSKGAECVAFFSIFDDMLSWPTPTAGSGQWLATQS